MNIRCPSCHNELYVDDASAAAGEPQQCPSCGHAIDPAQAPAGIQRTREPTGPHQWHDNAVGDTKEAAWADSPQEITLSKRPPQSPDPIDTEEDFDMQPQSRGRGLLVFIILILVLGGAGTGLYLFKPDFVKSLLNTTPPDAISAIASGYQDLAIDTPDKLKSAGEHFERALGLAPNYAAAHAGLAETKLAQATAAQNQEGKSNYENLLDDGFRSAQSALSQDAQLVAAHRALAEYYRHKKQNDSMRSHLDKAKALQRDDARRFMIMGSALVGDKTTEDRAVRYLDQAIELEPGLNAARYALAKLYWEQQQSTEKATAQLQSVLEGAADHIRSVDLLAKIQQPEEPEATPEPTPEPEKKEPSYHQLLEQAERLRERDKPRSALRLYEKATAINPSDPDGFSGMGWSYLDMDRVSKATRSFNRALSMAPRYSDAHLGLAETYKTQGINQKAIKHYNKYLDILPDGPESPAIKQIVEDLKSEQ